MVSLQLSRSDVETIEFALSVFPVYQEDVYELTPAQAASNTASCLSIVRKLSYHRTDLTAEEWHVIKASLLLVQQISRGDLPVDSATAAECKSRSFVVSLLRTKLSAIPSV